MKYNKEIEGRRSLALKGYVDIISSRGDIGVGTNPAKLVPGGENITAPTLISAGLFYYLATISNGVVASCSAMQISPH